MCDSEVCDPVKYPPDDLKTLSTSRVEELLDFVTVYGDWDENTPNGTTHDSSGKPMCDVQRASIIRIKAELRSRGVDVDN